MRLIVLLLLVVKVHCEDYYVEENFPSPLPVKPPSYDYNEYTYNSFARPPNEYEYNSFASPPVNYGSAQFSGRRFMDAVGDYQRK